MIQFLKENLLPKTIKKQFILFAGLVSIIPLIFVVLFNYSNYSNVTNKKVTDAIFDTLSVIDWNIAQIVREIESTGDILTGAEIITENLTVDPDSLTRGELLSMQNEAQKLLINLVNNKEYIDSIFVSNEHTGFQQRSSWKLNTKDFTYDDFLNSSEYANLTQSGGSSIWTGTDMIFGQSNHLLYYFRILKNINTLEDIGILSISINKSVFDDMLEKTMKTSYGDLVVMDHEKILYKKSFTSGNLSDSDIVETLPGLGTAVGTSVKIGNENYYISQIQSSYPNWKIGRIIRYDDLMMENRQIRNESIYIMLISILFILIIVTILSKSITKNLKLLMSAIRKWENRENMNDIIFDDESDIGSVGNEFIRVATENEILNKKLYQSMLKEKEAELMILQSQINPHFLYNTLNSIFWMAQNIKADNITRITLALSRFFKLSLNKGEKNYTLKHEIDLIKNYMLIQEIRYKDRFKMIVKIDESLYGFLLPKLLIQPLVENSIYHGLEKKDGPGEICVSAEIFQDSIKITVEDDGVGFDINSEDFKKGYAVKNIDDRIKLFYGEEYGMEIRSTIGTGTKAVLTLPFNDVDFKVTGGLDGQQK